MLEALLSFLLLLSFCCGSLAHADETLREYLSKNYAVDAAEGFKIKSLETHVINKETVTEIEAEKNSSLIKIQIMSPKDGAFFRQTTTRKIILLKSIYNSTMPTPYPGQITKQTTCDKFFLPKVASSDNTVTATAYADKDLTNGSCYKPSLYYHMAYFYKYIPSKSEILEIKIFEKIDPKNKSEEKFTKLLNEFENAKFN
ncbi:MAG: hypothetical protein ACXWQQ_08175 [Pseudobdellovibrio sp.]